MTMILASTATAWELSFRAECNNGKTIIVKGIWEISSETMTLVYFDTYHHSLGRDCSFYLNDAKITPVQITNGIVAFKRIKSRAVAKTTRDHSNLQFVESDLGFPVMRVVDNSTYVADYHRDVHFYTKNIINGLNISNTHYITPDYAFNSLNFPKAIRDKAVNICGEGWVYFNNTIRQERTKECVPRGGEYGRLYSVVTNETGAQMVLDYGTYNKPKPAKQGLVLINEYGEFMGFVGGAGKSYGYAEKSTTFETDADKYKSVKIGTQTWMAENLNDASKGGKCYANKPANCDKYGRLYTWEEARKACSEGWHLPSNSDWETLVNFAGGEKVAGKKFKAKSSWNNNGNGMDDYGFSALSGGNGYSDGGFGDIGRSGVWLSATELNSTLIWLWNMYYDENRVYKSDGSKDYLFSVRCVKN